ncbi:MAG: ASKHA domain-containing protein [Planctomycetota bacterium]
MQKYKITFFPENKSADVDCGTTVLEAARTAGLYTQSICGGDGLCGKCRVILKSGKVETKPTGLLKPDETAKGIILACQATVSESITVEIPPELRAEEGQIVLGARGEQNTSGCSSIAELGPDTIHQAKILQHSPLATKVFMKLPPPTLQDAISDLDRIYRELKKQGFDNIQTSLSNIKDLSAFLRTHNWAVTITIGMRNGTAEIVMIVGGDTSKTNYGMAVDIGTTTVVAHLIDLASGQTIGSMGSYNKQITYGDDIITRIIFAGQKEGMEKLHRAVVDNINSLIEALCREKGVNRDNITAVSAAGNPTMIHLLLDIDPIYIRKEPYIPTVNEMPVIRAAEAGIKINPRGLLACAPGISSYVGGDITAGLLVTGMTEFDELSLYIDMGTNGEMVLGNKNWLVCCACSAGPAFEGSGIRSGTRAVKGAIQKIKIKSVTQPVELDTIGNCRPHGICGSGLIEIISELFNSGIIKRDGKFAPESKSPYLRKAEQGLEYIIVKSTESATGQDIVISQPDIDNIIRSKAAVYAGTMVLLKKMGHTVQNVRHFYIAGGFGSHLDIAKSIRIGLLPDVPIERFRYIGNGSAEGARLILLSYIAMTKAKSIAGKMTYLELSADNAFTEEFVSALFLPHTDLTMFPNHR